MKCDGLKFVRLAEPAPFAGAAEMGTVFTYQGYLYDANHVANGCYQGPL